ncbi:MAG: nucleoside triphosphate pyrophosphohydrolase [Bacillales bacterium]|nr:nucleoside triphosphate pyrophosphohydrolase [Bacillales bacterium]
MYNKLVRDNIPDIIKKNGATPIVRILDDEEYFKELNRKLKEELNEYLDGNDIEELADLYEVMLAILDYKKMSLMEFDIIRKMKVEKRGAFKNKIYLESVIDNK